MIMASILYLKMFTPTERAAISSSRTAMQLRPCLELINDRSPITVRITTPQTTNTFEPLGTSEKPRAPPVIDSVF